ncbi:MAG: hypothetical protein JWM33_3073, partial [Caulobacteraceae bacterium]|nr:hypothetical protein [Caulobacteraceae bacterium]
RGGTGAGGGGEAGGAVTGAGGMESGGAGAWAVAQAAKVVRAMIRTPHRAMRPPIILPPADKF